MPNAQSGNPEGDLCKSAGRNGAPSLLGLVREDFVPSKLSAPPPNRLLQRFLKGLPSSSPALLNPLWMFHPEPPQRAGQVQQSRQGEQRDKQVRAAMPINDRHHE